MERQKETLILFPFMAQGHLIPFLALAIRLEQTGFSIIYVNTPVIIKKLKISIPFKSSIQFIEIPFDFTVHGFPPDVEITDNLPYNLVLRVLEISPYLELPFRKLVEDIADNHGGVKPLCIVSDFFFGWVANVAHDCGIFHAIFSGAGGFGLACYYSMWLNLPHRNNDDGEFELPDFPEAGKFHVSQLSPSLLTADSSNSYSKFLQKWLPAWAIADGFLFNTVEELDKIGLVYFRRKLGIPAWAIGPIFLPVDERAKAERKGRIDPQECMKWLDTKPLNHVLYISFGFQTTISASQMMQLARALDAGRINFIWVVMPPVGFDINADFKAEEWLPEGFVERNMDDNKGLVVEKWAPQLEILAHRSVGAFLSHCGWNSVLESLSNGVPLIGWPIAGDQFNNAKLLVEWGGVCVEVARGVNFEVRHEDIKSQIDLVMGENHKSKDMRRKALEIKEMIAISAKNEGVFKGPSILALEEFIYAARRMKEETTEEELVEG